MASTSFNPNDTAGPSSNNDPNNSINALRSDIMERNKKWQMEVLMERLRLKSSQHKPLQETSRTVRINMLEKRYALDIVEKTNLQKCLDRMQSSIKVSSRQSLVERLESLSRQLGLKFSDDNLNLFISSDMFYLEIILDASGKVHDVKVHHEFKVEQQSCQELVECLMSGDYADFTAQLEGFTSIYQLNADKKTKSFAFVALQALEKDLQTLYALQEQTNDAAARLLTSVGIVLPRRGGHPMRVSYFVQPYQLLDPTSGELRPISVDLFNGPDAKGMNATVHIEAAGPNQLPTLSTIRIQKDAQGMPKAEFVPLSADNSSMLPAHFVLRLNRPLVIDVNLLRAIEQITNCKFPDELTAKMSPLLSLIVAHTGDGQTRMTPKGLLVTLPDQSHCYYLSENCDMSVSAFHLLRHIWRLLCRSRS